LYDLRRTYLTCAEGMGLPPYALKGLVNHKQPNSDVTGGYLKLTPERLREPAQAVADRLLRLAKKRRGLRLGEPGALLMEGLDPIAITERLPRQPVRQDADSSKVAETCNRVVGCLWLEDERDPDLELDARHGCTRKRRYDGVPDSAGV
jgi:hypothetical protein